MTNVVMHPHSKPTLSLTSHVGCKMREKPAVISEATVANGSVVMPRAAGLANTECRGNRDP